MTPQSLLNLEPTTLPVFLTLGGRSIRYLNIIQYVMLETNTERIKRVEAELLTAAQTLDRPRASDMAWHAVRSLSIDRHRRPREQEHGNRILASLPGNDEEAVCGVCIVL